MTREPNTTTVHLGRLRSHSDDPYRRACGHTNDGALVMVRSPDLPTELGAHPGTDAVHGITMDIRSDAVIPVTITDVRDAARAEAERLGEPVDIIAASVLSEFFGLTDDAVARRISTLRAEQIPVINSWMDGRFNAERDTDASTTIGIPGTHAPETGTGRIDA